jgi:RNA polymerase primary sigma factor/RNA polymerase sigma factor
MRLANMEPVDERGLTIEELARTFNVSTKTVSRWRDHGLSSGQFDINGRQRVGFLKSSVDRFVAQNPGRIQRGARFSQLTTDDRTEIVERARRLAEAGRSLYEVSKQLAGNMNRSVETVRSTIKQYDSQHPESAIFGDGMGVLTNELRNRIYRQYRRGTPLTTLAKTLRRPVPELRRAVDQARAERIGELPLAYMPSVEFESEDADARILGPVPQPEHAQRKVRAPSGLPPYLASLYDFPLLTKDQEVHLFRKYNYAKYRAGQLREQLDPNRPDPQLLDQIERLYQVAINTKNELLQANLRLVVSIVKKRGCHAEAFQELVSDGNISLLKAIEKYDYTRGFKFSTYATWAIQRNNMGNYARQTKRADRYRTGQEELLDGTPGYRGNQFAAEAAQERHEEVVGKILECLDDRERRIIERRYGLRDGTEPQTLKKIGEELHVSKERVRQIETRALEKLREVAIDKDLEVSVG